MAATDNFETIWIKKEVSDEEPDESASTVQVNSPCEGVKEELEEGVNEEFLEESLEISWSTDFIKKEPELNLEVDGIENTVVTPTYEPDSIRLIQNGCATSFGETVDQEEFHNEVEKGTEESRHFIMPDTRIHGLTEKEGSLFGTRLKCSLKEKEFHRFCCSCCLQSFPSKYRLIRHVFIHIDGVQAPKYVCNSCGKVFTRRFSLKKHLKMNQIHAASSSGHNDKYQCSKTKQTILLKDGRGASITQQTGKQTSVNEIGKSSNNYFNNKNNAHTMKHNAEKRDKYDNYGTSCMPGNTNDHIVPRSVKSSHKCDVCGKSFTRLNSLKWHALTHTGNRPYKCSVCRKSFAHLNDLNSHALNHSGIREHTCATCGKVFTRLGELKNHTLIHTGERPHLCDICGKSFSHVSHLKSHTATHTGIRPHTCDICGKAFFRSFGLQRHLSMHAGIKQYKCDICGKSFTRLGHLKLHSLIHAGLRPHKCDVCGKSFRQANYLKRHILVHTGQSPYKCDVCYKVFVNRFNLERHVLLMHAAY